MTRPWRKYAVKKNADGKPASRYGCQKLTWVFHVTHIPIALRILEDARIRSDLVYDESRLNQTRTRVVWVSPNRWNNTGFRYGNVEFPLAWNQLLPGVKAYWVEVVEKYKPHACRILLSDQPHDDLERYDPSSGEGPWWVSPSGEHYWNGDYTLELLLERDIQLSPESICQFTKHHPLYCTINSKTCKYMNRDSQPAGGEFISGLVARRLMVKVDGQKQRPADKMFLQSAKRLIFNVTSRFKADVTANRLTSVRFPA